MRNFQCAPKNSLIFQSWLHLDYSNVIFRMVVRPVVLKRSPRTSSISLTQEPVGSTKYQDPPQTSASETLGMGPSNLCFNSPPDNYETWSILSIKGQVDCAVWIHDVNYKELINFGRYDWLVYNKISEYISCIIRGLPCPESGLPSSPHRVECSPRRDHILTREANVLSLLGSASQGVNTSTTAVLN